MTFFIIWSIAAVITAYGATMSYMKSYGEVSLLVIVGFVAMNILPPVSFIGALLVIWALLENIKFKSKRNI